MRRTFIQSLLLSAQLMVGGFAVLQDDWLWKARLFNVSGVLLGFQIGLIVGAVKHHWLNQELGRRSSGEE